MSVFTGAAMAENRVIRNTAVITGTTASFSCVIHAPQPRVCWRHYAVSPATDGYTFLYFRGNLDHFCDNNKCNVTFNSETDRYTLTINSVQHYDAGFYECEGGFGSFRQRAQLIVLQPVDRREGM